MLIQAHMAASDNLILKQLSGIRVYIINLGWVVDLPRNHAPLSVVPSWVCSAHYCSTVAAEMVTRAVP